MQKRLDDALPVKMFLNIPALDKTLNIKPAQEILSTISTAIAQSDLAGIQALTGAIILASISKG